MSPGVATDLPTLEVTGDPRDALAADVLRQLDARALGAWLRGRRWFGAKGSELADVRIAGAVRLPWGQGAAIALLEVHPRGGDILRYQLPLVVRREQGVDDLAEVRAGAARARLADASLDPGFRRALGEAFANGFRAEEGGLSFIVEPVQGAAIPALGDGEVGSAEQSNTSIRFGRAAICKLFRRVEPGENPDVEISRAITRGGRFAGTPELLGTARLQLNGHAMTAAMLQRLVPGAGDAWSFALERGRAYFADHGRVAPPNSFVGEARKLGRLTGEMHEALADAGEREPAFRPRRVDDAELERWTRAAERSVEQGLGLLESKRAQGFPGVSDEEIASILRGRGAFVEFVQRSAARVRGHAGLRQFGGSNAIALVLTVGDEDQRRGHADGFANTLGQFLRFQPARR
jgi:maltose alpha-D-glucosyltransferase/alpha-amylase